MRISGLASGFDTDEMVKNLMKVERMKVDRVEQNRQTTLWRQEQYNSINKQFANFILNTQKDMGLKRASSTGSLFGTSYKNVDYVKKATSSNETIATVSSTGKAVNGSFDIKVDKMAKKASYTSGVITKEDLVDVKDLTLDINGKEIKVSRKDSIDISIDDIIKAVNNATEEGSKNSLGVTAFYDSGTKRMFLQSSAKESDNTTFDLKFSIKSSSSGASGSEFITKMELDSKLEQGNKGKVTINGLEVETIDNKIQFNGLNIELKSESIVPITINVSTNTEGIMEKIEKLVADYNDLVDMASGLVNEKVYSSYKPLSSEERKALSEADLKLWDEKAKSGLLNRDETLQRTLQKIRTDLYKTLEDKTGSFDHITQIGISTEKYAKGAAGGKLQIDTEKLRKAIEEDADGVMELLFKDGNLGKDGKEIFVTPGNTSSLSTKGIFTRIYDNLIDGMKVIIDKSGPGNDGDLYRNVKSNMLLDFVTTKGSISDLDKSVNEMNRQIDNLNILLAKKEDAHYAKFTAMEKQMYKMQNQSSWLAQQFQF